MSITRLPQPVRLGLVLVVSGLVLAGALSFVLLPVGARMGERRAFLRQLRAKIADARTLAGRLPQEQAALAESQQRHRSFVERRIDRGQSLARVLETLSAQAQDRRLELVSMQPETNADGGASTSIDIGPDMSLQQTLLTLELTGRYRSIGEFLGWLKQAPFVASVHELTLNKPETKSFRVHAEVVLAVYLTGPGAG